MQDCHANCQIFLLPFVFIMLCEGNPLGIYMQSLVPVILHCELLLNIVLIKYFMHDNAWRQKRTWLVGTHYIMNKMLN